MTQPDFGFLAIDKPSGPTSHDIVQAARRICGTRKIGHGGTLDPLAEGLLVLAVGDATRLLEYVTHSSKIYQARILFGIKTTTDDLEGDVTSRTRLPGWLSEAQAVENLLAHFRGEIEQIPPAYSAVKVDGKRAYRRARAKETVKLTPRTVTILGLSQRRIWLPYIDVDVECSAGTYIRSLARDMGRQAGCGATLAHLRRTSVGHISVARAISWSDFTGRNESGDWRAYLLPASDVLVDLPRIELDDAAVEDVRHGRPVTGQKSQAGLAAAYSKSGRLVALLKGDPTSGVWKPTKVFPSQFN